MSQEDRLDETEDAVASRNLLQAKDLTSLLLSSSRSLCEQDYEWYSPEAVNTTGGALVLEMTAQPTHNLNFQSGMLQVSQRSQKKSRFVAGTHSS